MASGKNIYRVLIAGANDRTFDSLRELLPPKAQEWTAVSKYVLCCDKTAYCHGISGWQG